MRESFVVADDGTQLYMRAQEGPSSASASSSLGLGGLVSVLCDGIACDGFVWKYLWHALAARTKVAHFHYRGHGRSKRPADPTQIDVEAHARDLSAVRVALGDPEVVLYGHSMGCQVVLENYRLRPEKVRGLVLICGAPGRVTHSFKGSDALAQVLPRLIETVDKYPHVARAVWGSVPPELALKVALALGEIDGKQMEPRDLMPYLQHMVDIDLRMFLRMLRSAGEHSASDMLGTITCPALVIAGENDSFTPPRLAEEMARSIPDCELVMTNGTHVVPLEHKRLVEDKVDAFLEKIAARPIPQATASRPGA
ncbi:MAG: alpha/beta hydrolase [Myxococcales bacterium]|nr:alpha/beta hydrolase [Myxococcales bacterium]